MIENGLVTLRPWERADAVFVFEACQDPDIQRWTRVPRPYTGLDAATFIDRHARAQPEDDGAFFAITRTDNGELLGAISLHRIDWAFRQAEIGYWIGPHARREGVASAAVNALTAWGFTSLGLVELHLVTARENLASQGVARKAGYVFSHVLSDECRDGDDQVDGLAFARRVDA
jgi:RimJ/RimL family protein N-acetyltransferase